MGTNYYLEEPTGDPCRGCGLPSLVSLHIGKSSGGWAFLFRAHEGVRSEVDWRARIETAVAAGGRIVDEYDRDCSVEEFWKMVEDKRKLHRELFYDDYYDEKDNAFCQREFS